MNALLAKDLRISLDALRPLTIVVGGLLLVAACIAVVPTSSAPASLRGVTFPVAVQYFSAMLLAGAFVVAAWITASVQLGDGAHRAAALAASMPVGARTRWMSKAGASVLAVGGVLSIAWFAHQRTSEAGAPIFFIARTTVSVGYWVSTALAGAVLAGITARLCGTVWRTVATTLVSAIVIGVFAVFGAWGGYAWALAPLAGNAARDWSPLSLNPWEITEAWPVGAAAGLVFGFSVSAALAIVVLWCVERVAALGAGWRLAAIGICVVLGAAVGGALGSFAGVRGESAIALAVDDATHRKAFDESSDAEMLGSVAILLESDLERMDRHARQRSEGDVSAAVARMAAMSELEYSASPFARGLVRLAAASGEAGRLLAERMMYLPGERGLRLTLRFLPARRDASLYLRSRLADEALQAGVMTLAELVAMFDEESRRAFASGAAAERWRIEQVIELLDAAIERGHPLRVKLESARDFLRSKLLSMPPDIVRASPLPPPPPTVWDQP